MTNNIIKDLEADHQKILAFVNELEQRLIEFMEANIFDYDYSLNKNVTEITLNKITADKNVVDIPANTTNKEIVVPKKQTDEKINLMENDNKNLEQDNNTQSDKKVVTDKKNKQEKANTDVKK